MTSLVPTYRSSGRASLDARLLAAIIDLLIVVFVALPFAQFDSRAVVWILEIVGMWLYRRTFGLTPGQQIVGLHSASRAQQWLRGTIGIVVILYAATTLSLGFLLARLTDEKIDRRRVAMLPTEVSRPTPPVNGEPEEFERVSFTLPVKAGGFTREEVSCCVLFGGGSDDAILQPGILVAAMRDLHPYEYCTGLVNGGAKWVAGCGATPLDYQRMVTEVIPGDRLRSFSPLHVVRTNFALIAKSIYLEDVTPAHGIRRYRSGDADVLWLRGVRTVKKTKESVDVELDRFLIADATSFGAIDIVWKKVPRDERLAQLVASSICLRRPEPAAIQNEMTGAAGTDSLRHATNAFRMSGRTPETARLLRDVLAKSGTARQKSYFALVMASEAKERPEMRGLAATVDTWK